LSDLTQLYKFFLLFPRFFFADFGRASEKTFAARINAGKYEKQKIESQTFKKESPAAQSAPQDYPPFYFMIRSAVMEKESALLCPSQRKGLILLNLPNRKSLLILTWYPPKRKFVLP